MTGWALRCLACRLGWAEFRSGGGVPSRPCPFCGVRPEFIEVRRSG